MSMDHVKGYIEYKLDKYLDQGIAREFNNAQYIGLQDDGTLIYNAKVGFNIHAITSVY